MRAATIKKYRAVQQDFTKLYRDGFRYDVIIPKLQTKYFLQHPGSVMRILRTDIPPEETIQEVEIRNKISHAS